MITTLSDMCHAKNYSHLQILQLKQELSSLKKKGVIFFAKDISSLEIDDPFSIFYCLKPSNASSTNAFPVPIHYYYEYIAVQNKYDFMESFFNSYYEQKTFTNELFSLYSKHKAFLSDDYAWFYFDANDIA